MNSHLYEINDEEYKILVTALVMAEGAYRDEAEHGFNINFARYEKLIDKAERTKALCARITEEAGVALPSPDYYSTKTKDKELEELKERLRSEYESFHE